MPLRGVNRKWIVRLIVVSLVVTATIGWALHYPESVKNLSRFFPSFSLPNEENWTLEVKTTFSRCGHTQDLVQGFSSSKEIDQMIKTHPEYQVDQRRSHRVVCRIQKAGWCRSCHDNRFLGIENHRVAVIRGTPKKPGPVAEITPINSELLPAVERHDLKAGIPFRSEREKLQLLEGLNGLIVN